MPNIEKVRIVDSKGAPYTGVGKKFVAVNCENIGWHNAGYIEDVKINWAQYRDEIEAADKRETEQAEIARLHQEAAAREQREREREKRKKAKAEAAPCTP